jgi:hypothetical protein
MRKIMVVSNVHNGNKKKKEPNVHSFIKRNAPLVLLMLLTVSIVGYFSTDIHWAEFTFAHLGGLFIIGLMGYFSGYIAKKKGYGLRNALLIGIILPIFFGFTAGFLIEPISCGGSISLGVSVFIVIIYSIIKPKFLDKLT